MVFSTFCKKWNEERVQRPGPPRPAWAYEPPPRGAASGRQGHAARQRPQKPGAPVGQSSDQRQQPHNQRKAGRSQPPGSRPQQRFSALRTRDLQPVVPSGSYEGWEEDWEWGLEEVRKESIDWSEGTGDQCQGAGGNGRGRAVSSPAAFRSLRFIRLPGALPRP
mmetsp:Transcript_59767/g.185470  ORF Transcript_59767/g.185470 Transcript_59767/m.185470 type:complete len:164 (-) Transcript_59767:105-596(-)